MRRQGWLSDGVEGGIPVYARVAWFDALVTRRECSKGRQLSFFVSTVFVVVVLLLHLSASPGFRFIFAQLFVPGQSPSPHVLGAPMLSAPLSYLLPAPLSPVLLLLVLWQTALLLAIFGLFHPYPTLADPMLAGCLFLCFPRTSARMRLVIPVGMIALIPALLLPTMRHVWLQAGTGNANFYYFQTVILNVLLCVFVLQFAAALVKRRKALRNAFERRRKSVALEGRGGGVESMEGRS